MLTRLWDARSDGEDARLAYALSAVAGALNGAGLISIGVYTSNMTGNVSSLADHLAVGEIWAASGLVALLVSFVAGAAVSAIIANVGVRLGISAIYAFCILAEAGWLTMVGIADLGLDGATRRITLAFGLSFAMGLQNAVVTTISASRVRTTHVTGIATDIGIELGNLVDVAWGRRLASGRFAARSGLKLHALTLGSFVAGGVAGVPLYGWFRGWLTIGLAVALLSIALAGPVTAAASRFRRI